MVLCCLYFLLLFIHKQFLLWNSSLAGTHAKWSQNRQDSSSFFRQPSNLWSNGWACCQIGYLCGHTHHVTRKKKHGSWHQVTGLSKKSNTHIEKSEQCKMTWASGSTFDAKEVSHSWVMFSIKTNWRSPTNNVIHVMYAKPPFLCGLEISKPPEVKKRGLWKTWLCQL